MSDQTATDPIDEDFEERAGIMEFDGMMDRDTSEKLAREDVAKHRHECEVRGCIRDFYPDAEKMKAHLLGVEKFRGKAAADRLREDVRVAWRARMAQR